MESKLFTPSLEYIFSCKVQALREVYLCMFPVSLSINLSVTYGKKVLQSDTGDLNTLVPDARWQEAKELVWGMCGVVLSASGFSDAVCVKKSAMEGKVTA